MGQFGLTTVSVCVPLGIPIEPNNKELVLLVQYNHKLLWHLAQRENCTVQNKKLFGPMAHHMSLSKTIIIRAINLLLLNYIT